MAKNDQILIDGIIDERVELHIPSVQRDEVFEYFAFEQILKDLDLSIEELLAGSVDGRDDGGIDGFYIFVNGHLLLDAESFTWPRRGAELELWIVTCKHHNTFQQAPLDKLVASLAELFDLGIEDTALKGSYSDEILRKRGHLGLAYRKLSPRLESFSVTTVYTSRGDSSSIGDSVLARAEQVRCTFESLFGSCKSQFHFCGATELLELYRKVKVFTLDLPFLEMLSRGERYIVIARLEDYWKFVVDESSTIRRYLYDSNVRDFMGLNRVNEDIRNSLANTTEPDFWLLNNGITVLATAASVVGKSIRLEGVQIVNGLQTTESIARFFNKGGVDPTERAVLVKIVVLDDPAIRDEIIRATNNQTTVELASLHATDKIQRDIEDSLRQAGLSYERRKNFYANQGVPPSEIITPLYLGAGYVNLVLRSPKTATALRSRFMRSDQSYSRVFSGDADLRVWSVIAKIHKKMDASLEKLRPIGRLANERFLKSWRYLLALVTCGRNFGTFAFSIPDLAALDVDSLTEQLISDSWSIIQSEAGENLGKQLAKRKDFVLAVCRRAADQYSLTNVEAVECMHPLTSRSSYSPKPILDDKFLDLVDSNLPPQPWKPEVHKRLGKKLNCSPSTIYEATKILIEAGRRYKQVDGVVYDQDGGVIMIDPERVTTP